jgi:hypothetical protein
MPINTRADIWQLLRWLKCGEGDSHPECGHEQPERLAGGKPGTPLRGTRADWASAGSSPLRGTAGPLPNAGRSHLAAQPPGNVLAPRAADGGHAL